MPLVTVKDLLENAFSMTCSTDILDIFEKAVRQRHLILKKFNVPENLSAALEAQITIAPSRTSTDAAEKDYETLAACCYHYVSFKYWEESANTKLFVVEKMDFEDTTQKSVNFYRSKLPLCFGALHIRIQVGYRCRHSAVALVSPQALSALVFAPLSSPLSEAGKARKSKKTPSSRKKLVGTSDRKFSTSDTADGQWSIQVDMEPAEEKTGAATECRADLYVTLKVRCESVPLVVAAYVKLPKKELTSDSDDDDEDEDSDSESGGGVSANASLLSFGPLRVLQGHMDPAPLPRDPRTYPLPPPTVTGPTIASRTTVPHLLGPVESSAGAVDRPSLRLTPLALAASQTVSSTKFRQILFFRMNVVNLDAALVASIRMNPTAYYVASPGDSPDDAAPKERRVVKADATKLAICASESGGESYVPGNLDLPPRESLVLCVRAEFEVVGSCGSDHWQRTRFLHTSFPEECHFVVELQDEHAASILHTVHFTFQKPSLELPTRQSLAKDWNVPPGGDFMAFVAADDCITERRYCAGVFQTTSDDGKDKILALRHANRTYYISLLHLNEMAYVAARSGLDEVPIESFNQENFKAWLLVSRAQYPCVVYGLKLLVTTDTSSASAACHVDFGEDVASWIAGQQHSPSSTASSSSSSVRRRLPLPKAPAADGGSLHADPIASATTSVADDHQQQRQLSMLASLQQSSQRACVGFTIHYDELLGSGAFGQVYKAFDNASGMTCAVKETSLLGRGGPRTAESSVAEFTILTSLAHPCIVKVFALDVADSTLRVFMEWMPSGSVLSLLHRTHFRLHEGVIRRFALAALKGLAYLHDKSILHLDLKPANMLVAADGSLKLADFGTTVWLTAGANSVTTQQIIGTPAYMAPEIISSGKYSKASDVWAIGCCIVEMATGEMPWADAPADVRSSAIPLMFHIASAKPPQHCPRLPAHLSGQLRSILAQCFAINLPVRPTAQKLLEDPYFTEESLPMDAEDLSVFAEAASKAQATEQMTFEKIGTLKTADVFSTS